MTDYANGNAYSISVEGIPSELASQESGIRANMNAVITYISKYIRWQGVLDFVAKWDTGRIYQWDKAGAGFGAYGGIDASGDTYAAREALTGSDSNGADYDIGTWVSPYLTTELTSYGQDVYIDANPEPLETPPLEGRQDFYSIFLHEVFHGLGFWSTAQHGLSPTSFDMLTSIDSGNWYFIGPETNQYFEGNLPLAASGSRDHFSNAIPSGYNLNREFGRYEERWSLTGLELAVLKDLGYSLTAEGDSLLHTYPLGTDSVTGIKYFDINEDRLKIPYDLSDVIRGSSLYAIATPIYPGNEGTKKELKAYKNALKKINSLERKIGRTGDAFAYNQSTGEFFVDTNGKQRGFGEGGLLAILESKPLLGIGNIDF